MARPKRPMTAAAARKLASPAKRSASAEQPITAPSTFVSVDDRGSPSARARIERVASAKGRST